jgi:CO/xanthine dehydrogenase Mo-binding subunit
MVSPKSRAAPPTGPDINLPGMLYGKILRSPHAHARILAIDTRHAGELPRVYATMTSADLAQPSGRLVDLAESVQHNMRFLSDNLMAADKVPYKGHAVAAVAATSPHLAEEALALIQSACQGMMGPYNIPNIWIGCASTPPKPGTSRSRK